jgi:hypothetical protein
VLALGSLSSTYGRNVKSPQDSVGENPRPRVRGAKSSRRFERSTVPRLEMHGLRPGEAFHTSCSGGSRSALSEVQGRFVRHVLRSTSSAWRSGAVGCSAWLGWGVFTVV